jgi:hypothetical protein
LVETTEAGGGGGMASERNMDTKSRRSDFQVADDIEIKEGRKIKPKKKRETS